MCLGDFVCAMLRLSRTETSFCVAALLIVAEQVDQGLRSGQRMRGASFVSRRQYCTDLGETTNSRPLLLSEPINKNCIMSKTIHVGYLCRFRHARKREFCARQRAVSLIKLCNNFSQSILGMEAYRPSSELVVSAVRYILVRCWFANSRIRDTETPQLLRCKLECRNPLGMSDCDETLTSITNRFHLKQVGHRQPTSRRLTISVCWRTKQTVLHR